MQTTQVSRRVTPLAVFALAGLVAGAALIVLLQVLPPTSAISPVRRTISEYALGANKWIFDLAVASVALGTVAGFGALIRGRRLAALSGATVFGALWTVGLLVIVAFPKHNWAIGPSTGGAVHRVASVVAFVCLPIAVILAGKTVFARAPGRRRLTVGLAIASLLWLGVILGAIGVSLAGGGPWWQLIPLGLVERLLALTELFALGALLVPVRLDMTEVTDQAGPLRVLS